MKKLIPLLGLLIALPVMAQSYGSVSIVGTNVVSGDTLALTKNIDCRKQQNVAVSVAFQLDAAGDDSTNAVFTFTKSLDGSTFPTRTADEFTWTVALNGTNMVYATTNFNVGAVGYLRLKSIQNLESAGNMTNIVVSYAVKTKAP